LTVFTNYTNSSLPLLSTRYDPRLGSITPTRQSRNGHAEIRNYMGSLIRWARGKWETKMEGNQDAVGKIDRRDEDRMKDCQEMNGDGDV